MRCVTLFYAYCSRAAYSSPRTYIHILWPIVRIHRRNHKALVTDFVRVHRVLLIDFGCALLLPVARLKRERVFFSNGPNGAKQTTVPTPVTPLAKRFAGMMPQTRRRRQRVRYDRWVTEFPYRFLVIEIFFLCLNITSNRTSNFNIMYDILVELKKNVLLKNVFSVKSIFFFCVFTFEHPKLSLKT